MDRVLIGPFDITTLSQYLWAQVGRRARRVVQYSQIDSIGVSGDEKGLYWYHWYDWYQWKSTLVQWFYW